MAFEFKLPDIGEGVAEGEIVEWKVSVGQVVAEDDPLVEVMTDKATVEIPSPTAGEVLDIPVQAGDVVPVGTVIIVIGDAGEKPAPAAAVAAAAPAASGQAVAAGSGSVSGDGDGAPSGNGRPRAAPAVRKLAREKNIDLRLVRGTGPGGRITKGDVESFTPGAPAPAPVTAPAPSTPSIPSAAPKPLAAPTPPPLPAAKPLPVGEREERLPLRGIRRKIAEHLTRSVHTAPHFTYVDECDMTEVVQLRAEAKPTAEERGIKLTYLPFVIKALIPALREFPLLNASLDDASGEIVIKRYYNIGIAVNTDAGLMVPVVHDADRKGILELAAEIQSLADHARAGKLPLEHLQGGTFTITSTGNIGGVLATPIINHPEVAIMGIHKIKPQPVVRDGEIVVRQMMNISLSFDHRVVDGAVGASFANRMIRFLQDPKLLLLESL